MPHPANSVVRWNGLRGEQIIGDFALGAGELERIIERHQDWNLYVQPNPTSRREGLRVTASDITHWSWLLIDIDPVYNNPVPEHCLIAALRSIALRLGTQLHPTIIQSGRGIQGWVRLDDLELTADLRKRVRQSVGWLLRATDEEIGTVAGCRLDACTSDLPRIMRMPGSINQKTNRQAYIAEVGSQHRGVATRILDITPESVLYSPLQQSKSDLTWQQALPRLTLTASRFLTEGASEPGRHRAASAAAMSLHDHGVSADETLKALLYGARLCHPKLHPREVPRIVESAFQDD